MFILPVTVAPLVLALQAAATTRATTMMCVGIVALKPLRTLKGPLTSPTEYYFCSPSNSATLSGNKVRSPTCISQEPRFLRYGSWTKFSPFCFLEKFCRFIMDINKRKLSLTLNQQGSSLTGQANLPTQLPLHVDPMFLCRKSFKFIV